MYKFLGGQVSTTTTTTKTEDSQSPSCSSTSELSSSSSSSSSVHVLVVIDVAEEIKTVKKRNKEKKEEGFDNKDPLRLLGYDIMYMIISSLDARSVALCLPVSRGWHGLACGDRLWSSKCEELWIDKAHVPRASRTRGLSMLHAYSLSITDGKRLRITRDDLCDHAWEFHFTEGAPEYWRNLDPYWNKGIRETNMRRYFHKDGSQTCDEGDKVWGGHEACYCVVTGVEGNDNDGKNGEKVDGIIKMREHYVRINRWPQMYIKRKKDWGWEMSSHLFHYSSVPDPEKGDGTGPFFHFNQ